MESILRTVVIYVFSLFVMRLLGRRTLVQMTAFDLLVVLLFGSAAQQAMLGPDFSLTNALICIATLGACVFTLTLIKERFPQTRKWLNGTSTVLIRDGKMQEVPMAQYRIDKEDILESARINHGIGSMGEIRHAILEKSGEISIIPLS